MSVKGLTRGVEMIEISAPFIIFDLCGFWPRNLLKNRI